MRYLRKNVIPRIIFITILVVMSQVMVAYTAILEEKIDSLFVFASSGEVRYQDMVQPAIDSIAALGVEAVPQLVDKFTTQSARERWTVIRILTKIGSPAVPYLVSSLNRPDPLVVARVCWALGDIGDSAAVPELMQIAGHSSWWVREKAVDALGKAKSIQAEEVVLRAMSDTIGQVRKAAVVAAGRLTLNNGIELLVNALGDDFFGARMSAVEVLTKLDTNQVIKSLTDSIGSSNKLVGDLACRVLGQLGTDDALNILLIQTEASQSSRRARAAVALILGDPADHCGHHQMLLERETDRLVRLQIESALRTITNAK